MPAYIAILRYLSPQEGDVLLDASGGLVVFLFFSLMSRERERFRGFRSARSCIFPAKTGGGPVRQQKGRPKAPFRAAPLPSPPLPSPPLPRKRGRVRVGVRFRGSRSARLWRARGSRS